MVRPGIPIAVLDDEPQMRIALTRLLRSHGFDTSPFATGEDLLAAPASRTHGCLLLDLHMPGLTGFDVLAALAAMKSPLRVVVCTGHDEPGNDHRARSLGAVAYLLKPIDESSLIAAITTATDDCLPAGA